MSELQGRISTEKQEHIFLIGLDRVNKRNALDSHMLEGLTRAINEYENDPDLRCAVLFAHGDHFTAGLDLLELQPKMSDGIFTVDQNSVNPWGTTGKTRKKPVVVAVQGYCYTAGIELVLNADVAIAHSNTEFSQMEVLRGILPFGGATSRFIKAAGWNKGMRYLLTGEKFNAQTAYDLNLISEVVSSSPLERAIEIAKQIASAAPLAVQATLAAAKDALELPEAEALAKLNAYLQPLASSSDAMEGVMAMMQKRDPVFQGK